MDRRLFSLFALLLIASACTLPASKDFGTPASTVPGEVPFELAPPNDAAIIVPVKINGHGPFKFVLDTGATFTCIDQKLVDELKGFNWLDYYGGRFSTSQNRGVFMDAALELTLLLLAAAQPLIEIGGCRKARRRHGPEFEADPAGLP